jgi:hypothetical protein
MYDNKIRLSQDVLEKAELIAQEWGLKNARAAVEAVFRKYADEYLERHNRQADTKLMQFSESAFASTAPVPTPPIPTASMPPAPNQPANCEALSALDDLLGL